MLRAFSRFSKIFSIQRSITLAVGSFAISSVVRVAVCICVCCALVSEYSSFRVSEHLSIFVDCEMANRQARVFLNFPPSTTHLELAPKN